MRIDFFKYHALGNDYIVIDPNRTKMDLTESKIRLICHRNLGVGSDGILYGPLFDGDKIRLRIFNPDGSEAEKSGNGIRIFSRYLAEAGYVAKGEFILATPGGEVSVAILDQKASQIKVDMGSVTFTSSRIPVNGNTREVVDETLCLEGETYQVTCLSIGNPHCVIRTNDVSAELAKRIGPRVENHPMFPQKINMQLLEIMNRNNVRIEIWERGAGYTMASGSSSCAAASAAYKLGLVENQVKVHMPGGVIEIEIRPDGHVCMTGPVTSVSQGEFTAEFWEKLR